MVRTRIKRGDRLHHIQKTRGKQKTGKTGGLPEHSFEKEKRGGGTRRKVPGSRKTRRTSTAAEAERVGSRGGPGGKMNKLERIRRFVGNRWAKIGGWDQVRREVGQSLVNPCEMCSEVANVRY